MATTNDHTNHQDQPAAGTPQPANGLLIDDHSLNSSLDWEGDGAPYNINSSIQNLLQSDFPAEAQSHWLGDSLAFSAFFTASQYPNALWQTSSVPVLSTRELVDRVLDGMGLRRVIALQIGANTVTHCIPAVAKILHSLGHQCLCQSSVENDTTKVEDWLRRQVDVAVPELLWHAGRTPFARANYLMVLVEEIFRTLPISWSEAIAEAEDGHVLSHALKCINQAVNNAKVEPQAVLGVWAAENMIPVAHVLSQQHADPASQAPALEACQSDESLIPSPPESECTACLGSSCLWNLVDERLTAAVETAIADDDDAKSVGSPSSDRGGTRRPEETSPEATHSRASAYNNNSMPVVRKSRASAPEYDMKHHPVDDMLGDVDRSSRKRKRGDHGERQQAAKRKVSPIIIDD